MANPTIVIAMVMTGTISAAGSPPETAPRVGAPEAGPDARYCMRVKLTGNVIEPVRCWTREKWAEQGVDVDREWAEEGIRVLS